ncbi:MAG: hypothetical protein ACOC3V_03105 [bacterium]
MRKNELVPLYSTQRFIDLLNSINHEISYQLLEMIRYRSSSPISFFDFGDGNDSISFVTGCKVVELSNKFGDEYRKLGWSKYRSTMKIGKAIKLIFKDNFPINQPKGVEAPKPKNDIESFVNMYKAERDKNKNYDFFDIVKGEDIRYWYDQENYSRYMQEGCTLAKSCLRYKESLKYLDIYVKNPDVFSMLILKDSSNKLRARSIIWNLNEPENRIYMDRVYSINDFDVELFKTYAKERGWLYKTRQTYGYNHNIFDTRNNEEYNWTEFLMSASLKPLKYRYYPYLDTLSIYNIESGEISNNFRKLKIPPHIYLIDPQGGFVDEAEHREMVYSRRYGHNIPREESEYSEIDDDWFYSNDIVYVHNTEGRKAHINSYKIVFSNIGGKEKYFLKEDAIFSEYHQTYIYKDSVIEVYTDSTKKEKILSHKRLIGVIIDEIDGCLILNEKSKENNDQQKSMVNWGDEIDSSNLQSLSGGLTTSHNQSRRRRSRRSSEGDNIFDISDQLYRVFYNENNTISIDTLGIDTLGSISNIDTLGSISNDEQQENTSNDEQPGNV